MLKTVSHNKKVNMKKNRRRSMKSNRIKKIYRRRTPSMKTNRIKKICTRPRRRRRRIQSASTGTPRRRSMKSNRVKRYDNTSIKNLYNKYIKEPSEKFYRERLSPSINKYIKEPSEKFYRERLSPSINKYIKEPSEKFYRRNIYPYIPYNIPSNINKNESDVINQIENQFQTIKKNNTKSSIEKEYEILDLIRQLSYTNKIKYLNKFKNINKKLNLNIKDYDILLSQLELRDNNPEETYDLSYLNRKILSINAKIGYDISPKTSIKIGKYNFLFSDIFRDNDDNDDKKYDHVIMYTLLNKNKKIYLIRELYKSYSDGGWRLTPFRYGLGSISKGKHYTQHTKLNKKIIKHLENIKNIQEINPDKLLKIINYIYPINKDHLEEYYKYAQIYNDEGKLKLIQECRPGTICKEDYIKNINENGFPNFFIPDFNQNPVETYTIKHTLLGNVIIRVFLGKLDGKDIEWHMAIDKDNRIWIDRIRFKDNEINKYGTDTVLIDTGFLTSKPIEYIRQFDFNKLPSGTKPFKYDYYDITPILSELKPIKLYKESLKL
jgi:hypothetical protein